jgi:excinuclease UvrABC nuclease subunit
MSDLLTFIGGAAVGTLVTYLVKNEEARNTVERFIDGVGKRFTDLVQRATPDTEHAAEQAAAEPAAEAAEKPKAAKRATRPRRVSKAKKADAGETPIH